MENINYENCGVMLDLSHLLITNKNIYSYKEATDYIIDKIDNYIIEQLNYLEV